MADDDFYKNLYLNGFRIIDIPAPTIWEGNHLQFDWCSEQTFQAFGIGSGRLGRDPLVSWMPYDQARLNALLKSRPITGIPLWKEFEDIKLWKQFDHNSKIKGLVRPRLIPGDTRSLAHFKWRHFGNLGAPGTVTHKFIDHCNSLNQKPKDEWLVTVSMK